MSSVGLRERHIDRLLSEELEASSTFTAWFVRQVFGDQIPQDAPSSCSTLIGHHRLAGETDILVKVGWLSGIHAEIHIEDKLEALPQPAQALRYVTAVEEYETRCLFRKSGASRTSCPRRRASSPHGVCLLDSRFRGNDARPQELAVYL